jgi:hypothetical protein
VRQQLRYLVNLLAFLVVSAGASSRAWCDDPASQAALKVELDKAVAKLKSWRESFVTLRIGYRWSNSAQLTARIPELSQDQQRLAGWYHEFEWVWTDRQLFRQAELVFEDRQLVKRELKANNKQMSFVATYEKDTKAPTELAAGRPSNSPWVCPPLHRVLGPRNTWLTEFIDRNSVTPVELRAIDGTRCIGFQFGEQSSETIWLDCEHDGLVRRLETIDGTWWTCSEFQKEKTGRWFPWRGTYHSSGDAPEDVYSFEVVSVALNEPMPEREFAPPKADESTVVIDRTGGLLKPANPRKAQTPTSSPSQDTDPVSARSFRAAPRSHRWVWLGSLGAAVLFLIAGLGLLRKRRPDALANSQHRKGGPK